MDGHGTLNMVTKHYTHMTFFWARNSEILFKGWPGKSTGMYVLALIVTFLMAVLVEFFSNCSPFAVVENAEISTKKDNHGMRGLCQTIWYAVKIALAYLLMLAVMSFNVGVLIVAVVGHAVGFLIFVSTVFRMSPPPGKACDMMCSIC